MEKRHLQKRKNESGKTRHWIFGSSYVASHRSETLWHHYYVLGLGFVPDLDSAAHRHRGVCDLRHHPVHHFQHSQSIRKNDMALVPMVIAQDGRNERLFDIYSRMLRERI